MASFSKKLCRAVERRKLLYDRSVQRRVKRSHIDSAWEAVADECNESVSSVKTRWRNIRKVLLRFVSKANTSQTRKTRSKDYYLYEDLQFLLPHLVNVNPDDLADSDMEFGINISFNNSQKEGTPESLKDIEDSNDCLSTLSASENSSTSGGVAVAEKRKREIKTGQATPTKSLNAVDIKTSIKSEEKHPSSKLIENYVISDATADGSSSMRFRRVNTKAPQQLQAQHPKNVTRDQNTDQSKSEELKRSSESKLRTRSKSLYLERPVYEGSTDSDDDYNPPPLKKVAAVKDSTSVSTSTIVTRKRAAKEANPLEINKEIVTSAMKNIVASQVAVEKQKAELKSESPESHTNNIDDDDFAGIDMTLLAAAAEAEAAAAEADAAAGDAEGAIAVEDLQETYVEKVVLPPVGKDAAIQCDVNVDEEDDEFVQRVRKWLQVMTQRQKIIFRRGIYQAYIDVYDDPREFEPQKGIDKFTPMAHGVPAIFSGMTPVELRLVRHLAMAVSGHKITASSSPFANFDNKAQLASMRAIATNISNTDANTKLPTLPTTTSTQGSRTPPEKSSSNGGSGIVRTTAIALTNHNGRSGNCMPRILRKVVRVGNNNNNSNTGTATANASNVNQSTNALLQRNPGLLRHRLVTSNANGASGSDKQRVYRILPNGIVARQSPGPGSGSGSGSTNSPNSANSPTSFSQSFAMLCNSNNSPQTPVNKNVGQYRQILPKLSTPAPVSGATTITTVNASGEQKLSGISIRRHVATASGSDGRTQMSRRYSVCGSAPNELFTTPNKDDSFPTIRRSVAATMQAQQMVNIADPLKTTTRVRYAQNPSAAIRTGTLSQKFAVPSPVSNQSGQANKSPNNIMTGPLAGVPLNEPIPVAMSTWHTAQSNSQQEQEKQQMKLIEAISLTPGNDDHDPIANEEQPNDTEENILMNVSAKQNCIIASDAFESFVIKNEPLDLEEED